MKSIDKRQNVTVFLEKLYLGNTFLFENEDDLCVVIQNPYSDREDVIYYVDLENNEISYASKKTPVVLVNAEITIYSK